MIEICDNLSQILFKVRAIIKREFCGISTGSESV